ncbi:uncharacterized protein LOC113362747 [Papaver somniferum]|uniref:uncharacterized protein LOC113362747 n=1 Tax=Papaver somniferum TaxID=3469 RepID=UPI000E6F9BD7|nr:uncharacterized protein LOC113362747 [Papaver somniferum]
MDGPYITGKSVDGSIIPLPDRLTTYKPWVFHWPEEKKEVEPEDTTGSNNEFLPSSEVKGKYKVVVSKKRKRSFPSLMNIFSRDDALLSPEDSSSASSMEILSDLFSNSLSTINNPALGRACDVNFDFIHVIHNSRFLYVDEELAYVSCCHQ